MTMAQVNQTYGVIDMNTTKILEQTKKLVSTDREDKHGDKVQNHENIARLWSGVIQNKTKLNIQLLPEDVANMMALLKIARTQAGHHNIDDYVDACGYSAIAGEIANKRTELSDTLGEHNAKQDRNTNS